MLNSAIPAEDAAQLDSSVDLITASGMDGAIDLMVSVNPFEGAQPSPNPYRISIVLSPQRSPFDVPGVIEAARQTLTGAMPPDDWRRTLADAGYPDGFTLSIDTQFLPPDSIRAAMHALSNDVRYGESSDSQTAESDYANGSVHAVAFAWGAPAARDQWVQIAGDDNVIDLYSAPLYFRMVEGIEVTGFTPAGFPIVRRR